MSNQARIAVIGTGWWSTYTHIPGLLEHSDVELVAICDSDSSKLGAAAAAFGIQRTYDDFRAMLEHEQLDGVVVATNHASHFPITRACLEHGRHVMLEKPMTLYATEARELVQLARQYGRALIVGYPFNYAPHALRAREIISSGRLGAIQLITCAYSTHVVHFLRGDQGSASHFPVHGPGAVYSDPILSGGGQGHLQVTHAGGLLFWVSGLRAKTVQARMHKHGLALDLVDGMLVDFDGGALGTIGSTGNMFVPKHDLHIHCERGGVALDTIANTLSVRGEIEEQHGPGDEQEGGYRRFAPLYDLVDVVMGRGEGASAEAGLRTVELLDAAYRSAVRGGAAVSVAELYE